MQDPSAGATTPPPNNDKAMNRQAASQQLSYALKLSAFGRHLRILCLAIIIGALAGYGAVLFRYAIKLLQGLFYQDQADFLTFAASVPPFLKVGIPALGGLIVGLLVTFGAPEAKGHGVPEVMEAVALRNGRIRKRVALVKILASGICIGSGGSVGREGPIVQIGSGLGSTVGQLLKVKGSQLKTLIGCGAAAGIAATFNAPIAGSWATSGWPPFRRWSWRR